MKRKKSGWQKSTEVWAKIWRQTDGWVTCFYDCRLEGDLRWWSYGWMSPLHDEMKFLLRRSSCDCLMLYDIHKPSKIYCIKNVALCCSVLLHQLRRYHETLIIEFKQSQQTYDPTLFLIQLIIIKPTLLTVQTIFHHPDCITCQV